MGPLPEKREEKPAGIDFLDFIFTVAFSLGLTPEILNIPDFKGLLSQGWVAEGRLPAPVEAFPALTLGLGILTLALSWFGYHASMRRRPLQYDTIPGMVRFLLDIVLVVLYAVTMLYFRRLDVVLALLVVVYGLYLVWDGFKVWEYWPEYRTDKRSVLGPFRDVLKTGEYWVEYRSVQRSVLGRFRRELVTLAFCAAFIAMWLWCSRDSYWTLAIATGGTIFYRVFKVDWAWDKLAWTWERLFGAKHAG